MDKKQEIQSFSIALKGPRVLVYPLKVPIKVSSSIILPNQEIDRMDMDNSKKQEHKARDQWDRSIEHPYQAIVVAIGPEAAKDGYNIGDVVYTSYAVQVSRDAIKINGEDYILLGTASVYGIVGNIKLEEEKIKSVFL